jgi:P27 family predicted phage terminase small subunit
VNTEAKKIFNRLKRKYQITSDTERALLEMYAGAIVNMRQAQKLIDQVGVVVMDRYGIPKANPANDVLRINKTQAMTALRQLGLEEELEDGGIVGL